MAVCSARSSPPIRNSDARRCASIGLGDYDPSVNGTRLADTGINQPWSQYEKTIYFRDYDITALIQPGVNCVGVMLANAFWHNPNPPAGRYNKDGPQREASEPLLLCAEVILEQQDGTVTRVGTDASWRTTEGPIVFSHVYAGEDFDARRCLPQWDSPGFDDTVVAGGPHVQFPRCRRLCGKTGRRSRPRKATCPRPSRNRHQVCSSTVSHRIARPNCGSEFQRRKAR